MRLDRTGIWSTPIVLVLGLVLTISVLTVGLACVDRFQRLRRKQLGIEDFNNFLEEIRFLSVGGEGGTGYVELGPEGEILVEGTLARLVVDGENLRDELLPLPVRGTSKLTAGNYWVELRRGKDGRLFIGIRRV
jgi:hypothetical protein